MITTKFKNTLKLKHLVLALSVFFTLNINAVCNANFTYSTGANGTVNFYNTSTGTTASTNYMYNFGGGNYAYTQNSTYIFNSNGIKNICLTINDSLSNCISTKCYTFNITNASTITPCNANFTFTLLAGGAVNFSSTSSGTNSSTFYSWNFGGGSYSTGLSPNHTFTFNGIKNVCLTISDSSGCSSTKCDSINITNATTPATCNANFTFTLLTGGVVHFASTSTGTNSTTNYSWNFGGGSYGTGLSPNHTYSFNGIKNICLTLTDSTTGCSSTKCQTLNITNASTVTPCSAHFTYTVLAGGVVHFSSTSTGTNSLTNYSWNYGSGSYGTGLNPLHTFTSNGIKYICLTISDSLTSCSSTKCDSIYVTTVTGIKNYVNNLANIIIYPNPNNGVFTIELSALSIENKETKIYIYNVLGEIVFEKNSISNTKQNVDINNLVNGTYFIKLIWDTGYATKKISIQK